MFTEHHTSIWFHSLPLLSQTGPCNALLNYPINQFRNCSFIFLMIFNWNVFSLLLLSLTYALGFVIELRYFNVSAASGVMGLNKWIVIVFDYATMMGKFLKRNFIDYILIKLIETEEEMKNDRSNFLQCNERYGKFT